MALQTGVGLSRILILAGAGYTGTIMMKNGKLPEVLAEIQGLLGGSGDQNSDADLTAQLRRLASEVQRLGSAQRITVLNGSGSSGNITALIIPAATAGALGYGYMWWKGLSFSDLMYVTKKSMATAVTNLTKHLDHVSDALAATKKHLTQRIQGLSDKMDKQEELSKSIQENVAAVSGVLQGVGLNLEDMQSVLTHLNGKIDDLGYKQEITVAGVAHLCSFVPETGNKMDMPKILQDYLSNKPQLAPPKAEDRLSNKPRLALPKSEGLKALGFGDMLSTLDRSASDVAPDGIGNFEDKGRTLFRTVSTKC